METQKFDLWNTWYAFRQTYTTGLKQNNYLRRI